MSVHVQAEETIDLASGTMQVVCDPNNSRLQAVQEKLEAFCEGLDEEEMRFVVDSFAGDRAAESEGELLGSVNVFEDRIREISSETDFQPQAVGTIVATIGLKC